MDINEVPVFLSSCSPNEITGIAEAKNMYVVGANILKIGSKGNQECGKNWFFDCTRSEQ